MEIICYKIFAMWAVIRAHPFSVHSRLPTATKKEKLDWSGGKVKHLFSVSLEKILIYSDNIFACLHSRKLGRDDSLKLMNVEYQREAP